MSDGRIVVDRKAGGRAGDGRAGVAIFGATGYAGREAARLLEAHPYFQLAAVFGGPDRDGAPLGSIHPSLRGVVDLPCRGLDTDGQGAAAAGPGDRGIGRVVAELGRQGAALALLATPEETSIRLAGPLLDAGIRVVDLSGAFRLRPKGLYPEWYGFEHEAPELLASATYGLSEWSRAAIGPASLVANPGCYPTAALLALLPLRRAGLLDTGSPVMIHAVSGASGAGRRLREDLLFCEVEGSIRPYGQPRHRHLAEIAQGAGLAPGEEVLFLPHLAPIDRGLLCTISARLRDGAAAPDVASAYENAYAGEPFVRLLGEGCLPSTSDVRGTNSCAIGWTCDAAHRRATLFAAIDNLVKGAAGQAVQNLNLMAGRSEAEGLPR
ncbi:MAG TPA: N-acetyl-gamma-glutamyl-phosphate reductase [Candidatus Polarisedimenticolia bacterium]|jgi:N-acetyl-gamma-glutamyl-phosphate reductase|nr:N-acetyl-gamma-glutamyl-phosphate reductase [Candidatus Polarisedimenticolia bacterium]